MHNTTELQLPAPSGISLHQAAGRFRSQRLAQSIAGALRRIAAIGASLHAEWRRKSKERATFRALNRLDARTLRDLGFDRSELTSVAAEVAGEAECTRVRSLLTRHSAPV